MPQAAPGDAAGEGHPAVSKDTAAPSQAPAPGNPKAARRKLPPLESSLKDALRSVFLILQDCKVKGQCKLRARHRIAASASLRFPELFLMQADITKRAESWGGRGAFLEFLPLSVRRVWNLPRAYRSF